MDVKTVSPTSAQFDSATMTEQPVSTATTQEASSAVATITVESERVPRGVELTDIVVPVPANNFSADALQYDAVAINEYYSTRPLPVWRRRLSIVSKLASFGLNVWWDRRTGRSIKNQPARAGQLRKMLTQLGPAFIKIGQALSTRPDLVPPGYLEELAKLQDQLPPFPNKIAYQFIEEELGAHPDEIYAELSLEPVAAASLGQVYKGKLKTGETVAVKVQRPGLAESITLDVYILRRLAAWAQRNMKQVRSDLVAIADEFAARLFEEMDYTHEGHNAERFAELYGHLKDIYVPKIYWPYTGRRVLTMEWIDGTKLTNLESLSAQGIDASYLIELGVQCSLRQLLEHGFFHADPHPGNLMATRDGQLAYLDFGMMSEVKPYQRYGLIQAIVHLVNRDFEGLAHDYVKLEFLTPDTDLTPIIPALAGVFGNALGASVAELNFKSITDELSQVMYDYPFRVPAYYALIIRSLVTLEGIAINVDPDFKVLSKAYPYVAKRLLTDTSPELRSSLRDLLFKEGSFRWNRLENLLKNAKSTDDYDISQALNQALEFLFSERGDFIRDYLVDEIVKTLDTLSRQSFQNATSVVGEWFGLRVNKPTMTPAEEKNMEHFQRILGILQETKGFDPVKVASVLPQLILKPETQRMGKQIAGGLAQRALARLIRDVLLRDQPIETNGYNGSQQRSLSLPAQRTK